MRAANDLGARIPTILLRWRKRRVRVYYALFDLQHRQAAVLLSPQHMLGLGLRMSRPLASPNIIFSSGRWSTNTRSLFHLAAVVSGHPSCFNAKSRVFQLRYNSSRAFLRDSQISFNGSSSLPLISKITEAEANADADPNNVATQILFLQMLIVSDRPAGWKVVMSRWERMCEFSPELPLLHSDLAFQLYLTALVKSGHSASIIPAVHRREQLIRAHPATDAAATTNLQTEFLPAAGVDTVSNVALASTGLPPSRSLEVAKNVLSAESTSLPNANSSPTNTPTPGKALHDLLGSANGGSGPGNPIYVTIAEPRGERWRRVIKTLSWVLFSGFFILVIFSLFLEQTNFLKSNSRASEFEPMRGKTVKFSDVHGVDEAKDELLEVVEFLKDPTNFTTLGGKLPKGILLTGSPGTGKTMLARAVAGEAGVPFLFASGSEFEEIYVGVGAKRVRELFATARKKQPAIIFIDELDAIGGKRSNRDQQHLKQTLNQLLVEMDGFQQSEGVVVIAATNFPESLDQALVRPGRFDRIIAVPLPDVRGRVQILQHHMRNVVTASGVDPKILARGTPGFSGADLQNMVNQAAVHASREGSKEVSLKDFEWAKDRILMGAERKTHYITPEDKKCTAYHEGGHALVALYTDGAMPLHKVTCVTRGHALGLTQFLPEDDRVSMTRKEYQASIDVSMGGRVAEELIYGTENVSSGASSDIRQATRTASAMVRFYGYSDKIGPVFHHDRDNTISPQKREIIESEIQRFLVWLIVEGEVRAKQLLLSKEDELHKLADALVEYETLDLEEVQKYYSSSTFGSCLLCIFTGEAGGLPTCGALGAALARAGRPLVYGGGSRGIMGIVSGSTLEHGGEVIGVMPYAMYAAGGERQKTQEEIENGIDIVVQTHGEERLKTIVVNSMHERKIKMAECSGGFVGLPGGFGTYEEIFEVITWTQLSIHEKPVVLLNVLSFYSPLKELVRNGIKEGFIQPSSESLVVFVDGPSDLSQHEAFDWGVAALQALDSWTKIESTEFAYDWSKKMGVNDETKADNLENA
ncbi:hypothetical protein EW145_g2075 [Phellinidium pouzarii]|uniref:AAA+ ATPase domain-containing protein n=1 Tax=Phellinidium pouzarii TaxID=167371 RepID=A0A4S4LC83_9AGAM|nr:hypothetical protein EW145_g2075 [Phellinidium pouzarii]